jgi:hypothetical protein
VKLSLDAHPLGKRDGAEEVKRIVEEGGLSETKVPFDVLFYEK